MRTNTHEEWKGLAQKIKSFADLQDNWDSYGACKISELAINRANEIIWLLRLGTDCVEGVVPTNSGGIQFEIITPKGERYNICIEEVNDGE